MKLNRIQPTPARLDSEQPFSVEPVHRGDMETPIPQGLLLTKPADSEAQISVAKIYRDVRPSQAGPENGRDRVSTFWGCEKHDRSAAVN